MHLNITVQRVLLLYNIGIQFYLILIRIAAPFHSKARLWIRGRKGIFQALDTLPKDSLKTAWFHAASLGEFEQARPVMEAFRKKNPDYRIVLTFFSPSGYEIRKNYTGVDHIFYLPADTASNAKKFIEAVRPTVVFFVKYEYWYHYLHTLHQENIPVILFSAIFRKDQVFFKPWAGFFRRILSFYQHIFVQDDVSLELLQLIQIKNASIAGDTRFDRVIEIYQQRKILHIVHSFKNNQLLLALGSSWKEDMEVIAPVLNKYSGKLKLLIAPHEISESTLTYYENVLSGKTVRYSNSSSVAISEYDVLLIDNIGMLSSLYQYADFAYIGGAFGKGLHNILEAAVYGMPVFFGPRYQKFREAVQMLETNAAISIRTTEEFSKHFAYLYKTPEERKKLSGIAADYVKENTGATSIILQHLSSLRL